MPRTPSRRAASIKVADDSPICPASFVDMSGREPSLRLSGRCCYQNVSRWSFSAKVHRRCRAMWRGDCWRAVYRPLTALYAGLGSPSFSFDAVLAAISTRSVPSVPHPLARHDRSFLLIPFGITTFLPGDQVHNLMESPVKMWLRFAQTSSVSHSHRFVSPHRPQICPSALVADR